MNALLLCLLSQVATSTPAAVPTVSPVMRTFSDGKRSYKLYESMTLVAEPSPTEGRKQSLRALDPSATVLVERPTMRIWKVRDAAALRSKLDTLRPVFHDVASGAGRFRVPLGLVCNGESVTATWLEVLERSGGAGCLPDFWYPPVLR